VDPNGHLFLTLINLDISTFFSLAGIYACISYVLCLRRLCYRSVSNSDRIHQAVRTCLFGTHAIKKAPALLYTCTVSPLAIVASEELSPDWNSFISGPCHGSVRTYSYSDDRIYWSMHACQAGLWGVKLQPAVYIYVLQPAGRESMCAWLLRSKFLTISSCRRVLYCAGEAELRERKKKRAEAGYGRIGASSFSS